MTATRALQKIMTCLWFDTEAEEAAAFYTSLFPGSRVLDVSRFNEAGPREPGTVMTVRFELAGQQLVALNGGPQFSFTEAVSLQVNCDSQDEVDTLWKALSDGGEEGPCGWLKDRFGLSWQIVPVELMDLLNDPDAGRAQRAMTAMLAMRKIDIAEARRAADGG